MMIDIRIKTKNHKVQSSYTIRGETSLGDISLTILELERIKQRLLKESHNYEPLVEIKNK